MGILYIVSTPIGNMGDITLRAIEILKKADAIVCEDSRITKKLLDKYQIDKQLINCHQHSGQDKLVKIVDLLKNGKNLALVTDAGTPGVNDPGGFMVEKAIENDIDVVPIPGANALMTLLSVSGINSDKFIFLGFLPKKKGRQTLFKNIERINKIMPINIICYESCHRIIKTLIDFSKITNYKVIIGREMTKKFEEFIRGDIKSVIKIIENNKNKQKGEFVICLSQE